MEILKVYIPLTEDYMKSMVMINK